MPNNRSRIIVALDVPTAEEAKALAKNVNPQWVKVGLELFCAAGPNIVADLARDYDVMLDLKLHDIPATVGRTVKQLRKLGARMLTVHTAGGASMLAAAVAAADDVAILGVTVLTSLDEAALNATNVALPLVDTVAQRAALADAAGAGIVCAPTDAKVLRANHPTMTIVTPGVRPRGVERGDQKRVATPAEAIDAGANFLVIGRAIRDATDPAAAYAAIVEGLK